MKTNHYKEDLIVAQVYKDDETDSLWTQFFQEENEELLKKKMEEFKRLAEESKSELIAEVEGESLEECREKLIKELKEYKEKSE